MGSESVFWFYLKMDWDFFFVIGRHVIDDICIGKSIEIGLPAKQIENIRKFPKYPDTINTNNKYNSYLFYFDSSSLLICTVFSS